MIISDARLKIYFGDARDEIIKVRDCRPSPAPLRSREKFSTLINHVGAAHVALLNQTHSIQGMLVTDLLPAFDIDGDFLVTAQLQVGIGVLTADCLPVVLYDQKKHAVSVIHAGWRGAAQRICQEAVKSMQKNFGTEATDLKVFLGPSAKNCCYQVASDFKHNFASFSYAEKLFLVRQNNLYFDLPAFNILQLQELGVSEHAIWSKSNFCTICDVRFFSHRRQGDAAGRQITLASLG